MAAIREVTRNPDGTFDLLAVGTRRFSLRSVDTTAAPFLVGEVDELDESVGDGSRARTLARSVSARFIRYVELVGSTEDEADADGDDDDADDDDDETERTETVSAEGATAEARPADADESLANRGSPLTIPDDPTMLSYLLGGILAVEPVRRQELLEAETAEDRLALLGDLLDREILLLGRHLETYVPDPRLVRAARN